MIKNLLLLLLLSVSSLLVAQNVSFTVNPVETVGVAADQFVNSTSYVVNNGSSTVSLKWDLTVISQPNEWIVQVCDKTQCWASIVTSNVDPVLMLDEPVILDPDSASVMKLQITPNNTPGCGYYRIDVSTTDNPNVTIASAEYTVGASDNSCFVTNVSNLEKTNASIYPNPVTDFFSVEHSGEVQSVEVYNLVGKRILSAQLLHQNVNVSNLASGVYLVKLLGSNSQTLKTLKIVKK